MKKTIQEIIKDFADKLPSFPDGRIDYSHSDVAPVITVFVKVGEEILLLKRSNKVGAYKGKWNAIGGYLDEARPIEEKAKEELGEELGIGEELVVNIKVTECYELYDKEIKKTWIMNPILVELKKKPEIKLDWEHTDYAWIKKDEISNFDTVMNLENTLKRALG